MNNNVGRTSTTSKTATRYPILTPALLLVLVVVQPAAQAEEVTVSESKGVSVTVYNQNFGVVKDIRSVRLSDGINNVRFEDVAARIDPTSVSFQSITAPNSVLVREQNYQYDLLEPNTILSKSVGKGVKFKQFLPNGAVNEISGTLLNSPSATVVDSSGNTSQHHSGLVVKTQDGIVLHPVGEVHLTELPSGLVAKPSLLWKIETTKAGDHRTEIAYQTAGLNWKCDYVAVLNKEDNQADLTSWVTLDNKSGGTFNNASLKLVAGDVHRVQPEGRHYYGKASGALMEAARAPQQFQEQNFSEYHLYSLQGQTDLKDKETKQMSLFSASQIPTKKLFVYDSQKAQHFTAGNTNAQKVQVKFELTNNEKNKLGMALPAGKVRVYKRDQDGALQFIGEDQIDHTPRDEKVRLYIGDAFDVVAERKQTGYRSTQGPSSLSKTGRNITNTTYEISLRNHKDTDISVLTIEHTWGDWTILNSSQSFKKTDSTTFEFDTKVPANGEVKITYEIEQKN